MTLLSDVLAILGRLFGLKRGPKVERIPEPVVVVGPLNISKETLAKGGKIKVFNTSDFPPDKERKP